MPKAVAIHQFGGPDVLGLVDVPEPVPGPGQVTVRVRATGVNGFDCRVRSGGMRGRYPVEFPQIIGNEFAGIVERTGPEAAGFAPGDEVLGFAVLQSGTEVLAVGADQITGKPPELSWEVAGSLSAVGQTADIALAELRVGPGDTVLVHAAAGGVGSLAVQLVRERGGTAIGSAGEHNHDYLRSLGALPVAYGPGFADRVRALAPDGVDAALDCHGGPEALAVSLELVADRARIATIANFRAAAQEGIVMPRVVRSAERLAALAALCAEGRLRPHVEAVLPFAKAAEAHHRLEQGHVRGKLVLVPDL
ncbi:NADP-dependent oxidoreductase [Streptomyces sp. NPDC059906]|uniref:NADP-dependent oxidoreductase n=1 Tax=Streptomyces sp. NPDC059906 TaxID=3346997 RepID=UPI0036607992